jgi:DnaJ-class molecular chaperone
MKPWEVLGVSPKATRVEITRAYRVLAYIFHPDRYADSPPEVQHEAERRMAQVNKAYELAKRGRQEEVTFKMGGDERAHAQRVAMARNQPAWQDVVRQRAKAEAQAKQVREARERAMTNGQARIRPKSRSGQSVMAGMGEALHTGKLYCRGCRSVQWLPEDWRSMLAANDFFCSVCDRLILSRGS